MAQKCTICTKNLTRECIELRCRQKNDVYIPPPEKNMTLLFKELLWLISSNSNTKSAQYRAMRYWWNTHKHNLPAEHYKGMEGICSNISPNESKYKEIAEYIRKSYTINETM